MSADAYYAKTTVSPGKDELMSEAPRWEREQHGGGGKGRETLRGEEDPW